MTKNSSKERNMGKEKHRAKKCHTMFDEISALPCQITSIGIL